jgi:hypothetical protein
MSSHSSSANLMMDMAPGNKIVSLTPTLSLNQLSISQIQSYMKPGMDGMDVDHSDTSTGSTPADSPRKGHYGDRISSVESSGSSPPGLWLGSRRSPGSELFLSIILLHMLWCPCQ